MAGELFCACHGKGGQPLLLLHGFGGSHHIWKPLLPSLSQDRLVLAPDLPGHAGSLGYPEAGPVKVAVRALIEMINAKGIGSFHLVGHSMGGAIASLMALANPERIASLTLLAPGGYGPEINIRLLKRYAEAVSAEDLRPCLEEMVGYRKPVNDGALEQLAAMRGIKGQREMLKSIADNMTREGKQGVIPRDQLATLPMPVKLVWGVQDRVLPVTQAHDLPAIFARHIIGDTGHMLIEEQTDLMVRLICENIR